MVLIGDIGSAHQDTMRGSEKREHGHRVLDYHAQAEPDVASTAPAVSQVSFRPRSRHHIMYDCIDTQIRLNALKSIEIGDNGKLFQKKSETRGAREDKVSTETE